MPSLRESLEGKDLGHLALVAECWGIEVEWSNKKDGAVQLARKILDDERLFAELYEALPVESQGALEALKSEGGKEQWTRFERQYGAIRPLGAAQRDKLQPQREPVSETERLWYRALIGRAFLEAGQGPQEYAYLPSEFVELIPSEGKAARQRFGRAATPDERKLKRYARDKLLDEVTSLLAAKRGELDLSMAAELEGWKAPIPLLIALSQVAGVLDSDGKLVVKRIEGFLTEKRGRVLGQMAKAWKESKDFNELHLLPGLQPEGRWRNQPHETRAFLLEALRSSASEGWLHVDSFIQDIKASHPDFQRSGGQYEAWYLKDNQSGEYLKGFESWERVEGALMRFFLEGPAYWLGLVELGFASKGRRATSFRLAPDAAALLEGGDFPQAGEEDGEIKVDSQGLIQVPRNFPRAIRYQISRFCRWEGLKKGAYRYRIEAAALERARQQGLAAGRLLPILEKHADSAVPPNLVQAIERWDKEGNAGRAEQTTILRLRSPEIMEQLRQSRAKRYLREVLGPKTVAIEAGALRHVRQALTELGYLADFDIEEEE